MALGCNDTQMEQAGRSSVPLRIKVPSRTSCLAVVCTFAEGACRALAPGLSARTVHDVQLAVNEACANIIRHAYAGDADQAIWVSAQREDDMLVFTTFDTGPPADGLVMRLGPAREPGGRPREQGYGLLLIRRLMDEVAYTRDEKRGNVLVMKKRCVPAGAEGSP